LCALVPGKKPAHNVTETEPLDGRFCTITAAKEDVTKVTERERSAGMFFDLTASEEPDLSKEDPNNVTDAEPVPGLQWEVRAMTRYRSRSNCVEAREVQGRMSW
jgi:hypothetical protein